MPTQSTWGWAVTVTVTVMMMRGPPCVSVGSGGVRGTRSTSAHTLAMQVAFLEARILFFHSSSPTSSVATARVAEVQLQLPGCLLTSNSPACCTATPRRCCTCTETPQLAVQHLPDLLHSNCTTFGTVYLPDFQCKTDDNISMHLPWRRSEPLVV